LSISQNNIEVQNLWINFNFKTNQNIWILIC